MTMTSGMKRFRSIVGPVLVVAAIFGPIAFLEASLRSNQTPKLSDPHSVQGTFIVGTMKKTTRTLMFSGGWMGGNTHSIATGSGADVV